MTPATRKSPPRRERHLRHGCLLFTLLLICPVALAQLRIATWNITNYNGGRIDDIQTAVYGSFEGRVFAPDVIIGQEFMNAVAVATFTTALNTAPGSPGDWVGVYAAGGDTGRALFYRTGRVTLLSTTTVSQPGSSPNPPRSTPRFDLRPVGYLTPSAILACYGTHMKAGTSSDDQLRRLTEAERIRADALALPAAWQFLVAGDFNMRSSIEAAYGALVGGALDGPFFDPISSPGTWYRAATYRFIHTQDPSGAGGMDDRFDQILLGAGLLDGDGFEYLGDASVPYSTTTWNDPYHSYRAWGNDGTSFNMALTITGNAMVGSAIAQALRNVATTAGGHLPVYLDLCLPAKVGFTPLVDFGTVVQGTTATALFEVWNAGHVALWTAAGIAPLEYVLVPPTGFAVESGPFFAAPGAPANSHTIVLDTGTPGEKLAVLTILATGADEPSRLALLRATVVAVPPLCRGDLNCDGVVDFGDIALFIAAIKTSADDWVTDPAAGVCPYEAGDFTGDGSVNFADISGFIAALKAGTPCPN